MRPRQALAAALLAVCAGAEAACTVSAQDLGFGGYSSELAAPTDTTGVVTVTCSALSTVLLTYRVSLSTGGSGQYAFREMARGGHRLRYNLYTNAARTLVWGDGSGGTQRVQNSYLVNPAGVSANHTVYGRMPALQAVAVGAYADTITVTVEY